MRKLLPSPGMPVSYTHLDVYKRQHPNRLSVSKGSPSACAVCWQRSAGLTRMRSFFGACLPSHSAICRACFSPRTVSSVSYTHLDVYKRQFLHDALDESGYTVLVATNGESALQRARQSLPHVILLDAMMPGMDGFEVARRLKADFATQHIPIVFMTGLTETEHVVAAFAAGGADYVTKPIRAAEVLARIAAHMQNAHQIKQARTALDLSLIHI